MSEFPNTPDQSSEGLLAMEPCPPAAPVAQNERVASVDVLRGFALLGIFVMNIPEFALPSAGVSNPTLAGGFTGADFAAWLVSHLFFDQKMMSIFSMLFGAGLVLMSDRMETRGVSLTRIYYRRVFWLLVFGLIHAYMLWDGDVLYDYALCGMILYPARGWRPQKLIGWGLVVFLLAVPITTSAGYFLKWVHQMPNEELNGPIHSRILKSLREKVDDYVEADQQSIDKEIENVRGGYWELFQDRLDGNLWEQTVFFVAFTGPRVTGLMLLGMAFMKWGIFGARKAAWVYMAMMVLGYGLGLSIIAYGTYDVMRHGFDILEGLIFGDQFNYLGSPLVALGHVGLIMLLCQRGWLKWLQGRLAAVGRMALTNYIVQSLIGTSLFYGWGLGRFACYSRSQLIFVVAAVWFFQMAVSPLWLRFFRFGPMEWLWRSLTYWRLQRIW